MQKKIIVLAIASALTAPVMAFADTTVFGTARLSVDIVNDGKATNSSSANQLNLSTDKRAVPNTVASAKAITGAVRAEAIARAIIFFCI